MSILWAVIGLLLLFWLVGLVAHVGGALINVLLIVAIVAIVFNLFTSRGRRAL